MVQKDTKGIMKPNKCLELEGSFYRLFLLVSKFLLVGGEGREQSLIFVFLDGATPINSNTVRIDDKRQHPFETEKVDVSMTSPQSSYPKELLAAEQQNFRVWQDIAPSWR